MWNNMARGGRGSEGKVLEYVGTTLSHSIAHNPALDKDTVIKQIIQGLIPHRMSWVEVAYMHSLTIIHRDLKVSPSPTHSP